MNITAYLWILGAALFLALYDIFRKMELVARPHWKKREALFTTLFLGSSVSFLTLIALCEGSRGITHENWWPPIIMTGVLNVAIQFFNVKSRALEDVSLVNPITATTPVVLVFASFLMLGEYPTLIGWTGIMAIAVGTYLLNIQTFLAKRGAGVVTVTDYLAPFHMLGKSRGVQCAFVAALIGGVSLNLDALATRRSNPAFACALIFSIAALGNLMLARARNELCGKIVFGKWLVIAGLCFAVANYATGMAFCESPAPYVGTLKRLQVPVAILLAYAVLGERLNFRNRLLGGTIMVIGAILIGIS